MVSCTAMWIVDEDSSGEKALIFGLHESKSHIQVGREEEISYWN